MLDLKQIRGVLSDGQFSYIKGSKYRIPKLHLNYDFAMWCGLLWGDGCIVDKTKAKRNFDWKIHFSAGEDLKLAKIYQELTKKIFNITPHIFERKDSQNIEVYFSNRLVYELLLRIGFIDGEKLGKLRVPNFISKAKALRRGFMRGLHATDGTFYIRADGYAIIGIDSATKEFIEDIGKVLELEGLEPKIRIWKRKNGRCLFQLRLNGKPAIYKFFNEFGSLSIKHDKLKNYISSLNFSPFV